MVAIGSVVRELPGQIAVNPADEFDLIGCPREEPWLTERE